MFGGGWASMASFAARPIFHWSTTKVESRGLELGVGGPGARVLQGMRNFLAIQVGLVLRTVWQGIMATVYIFI
jgi:hypothetical protein